MSIYFVLILLIFLISIFVQLRFKNKFAKYAETQLSSALSGKEVAEMMLHEHGIYGVRVVSTEGALSDHYNPSNKTVNLSTDVYYGRSVAAAAVAAHECGHAVQHEKGYHWLQLRTEMVPVVSISSNLLQWVILIGILLIGFTGNPVILSIGTGGLALITLFSLITLPVEFDASKRALAWLRSNHGVIITSGEAAQAKDALWWASMTYVVAASGAIGNLMYYFSMLFGRDEG